MQKNFFKFNFFVVIYCNIYYNVIGGYLMRLLISKSKNKIIYYGVESYRENGIVKTYVAKKFGAYDILIKSHDNPEDWVKGEIKRINDLKKENIETFEKQIDYNALLDSSKEKTSNSTLINIGCLYLNEIYKQLKINECFASFKGKEKYDATALFKFLITSRILNPKSKRATIFEQSKFLSDNEFKLQEAYKILPILSSNDEIIQKYLFENTKNIINLETEVLFYDCTNFYFENEEADEDLYDLTDENILQYGLRKYGVSKEHRPNPIVQMGLFTDKNGIPIAYSLNPGNTNEQITVKPIENRIINQYKTSKFIYCADGGLNSADIKLLNSINKRKYIVSQSLKKTKEKELDLILSDNNWFIRKKDKNGIYNDISIKFNDFKNLVIKFAKGEELTEEEKSLLSHDRIYKKYPMKVHADLQKINPQVFKEKQLIQFEETFYITFSAKQYLYQSGVFNKQLLRAENIINCKLNSKINPNDPKRLIKEIHCTKEGEVACNSLKEINNNQVECEERLLGLYCIATNIEDKTIEELLEINTKRWRIELNFRIMKSYLDSRPCYVSSYDAIKGHFLICYSALLTYSLLEKQLNKEDEHLNINNIINTLKNMNVVKEDEGYYKSLYTDSITLQRLESVFKKQLNKKYYRKNQLTKLL